MKGDKKKVAATTNYLVWLTFLPNGSNENVIRFTAFKFKSLTFFDIADIKPPDRVSEPVVGIDMAIEWFLFRNSY